LLPPESALKAIRTVEERRVIRVSGPRGFTVWLVRGERKDYLVFGDFYCSCADFYMEAMLRRGRPFCYHIVAKEIAEEDGKYVSTEVDSGALIRLLSRLSEFHADP